VLFVPVRLQADLQLFARYLSAESVQVCLLIVLWQAIVSAVPGDDGLALVLDLVFFLAGFWTHFEAWTVVFVVAWVLPSPSAFLLLYLLRCR